VVFATAYMMLVTCNTQGDLTALERGLHALRSGKSVRDYAAETGGKPTWVAYQRQAAEVFTQVNKLRRSIRSNEASRRHPRCARMAVGGAGRRDAAVDAPGSTASC
jgi:hypothetical protein